MDPAPLLQLLHAVADGVAEVLTDVTDWGPSGRRPGQYAADLLADAVVVAPLHRAGIDVLSEESGSSGTGAPLLAIVDPLDGSTNASRGIPWFATSLCILDAEGPLVGLVADQTGSRRGGTGPRWWATRGGGAFRDGRPIRSSGARVLGESVIGLSGLPPRHLGWAQFRALGAIALDLCHVADGTLDGFLDCSRDAHGAWDHAAASLVCHEAGAPVVDAFDRDLVPRSHTARRTPVAGASVELLAELVAARTEWS